MPAPPIETPSTAQEAETGSSQPPIDWRRAAEDVARDHAAAAEAERAHKGGGQAPPKKKSDFRWSWRAHRAEPIEGGGILVHLSERCSVAISVLPLPFCKFGEIPARGDLFDHMRDPPEAGDWKDE